jgi:hypothetical protein
MANTMKTDIQELIKFAYEHGYAVDCTHKPEVEDAAKRLENALKEDLTGYSYPEVEKK